MMLRFLIFFLLFIESHFTFLCCKIGNLQTVLWPDCRWKPVGLGDLLEPRQVKLQYRKAMLVVHPDHNVKLSNEHRYICKRIFEAVNEAYNDFTTKESV